MPAILLVDDEQDAWEAVRLALEPRVTVHTIDSLHGALNFLRTRAHEICGVIVDLNLTDGTDNFGRVLLERLREISVPCVVFSGNIRSPEDAKRYQNEFGVLGTIGKGGAEPEGVSPLQQLRDSVEQMIAVSVETLRDRVRLDIEHELVQRDTAIERERRRSSELVEETRRVAGSSAAKKLEIAEAARIAKLSENETDVRNQVMRELRATTTIEDLERLRTDILRRLGAL